MRISLIPFFVNETLYTRPLSITEAAPLGESGWVFLCSSTMYIRVRECHHLQIVEAMPCCHIWAEQSNIWFRRLTINIHTLWTMLKTESNQVHSRILLLFYGLKEYMWWILRYLVSHSNSMLHYITLCIDSADIWLFSQPTVVLVLSFVN